MYTLFSLFTPFIAAVEGKRGFPCFHYFAIPLLILLGFTLGWLIRKRYDKGKTGGNV